MKKLCVFFHNTDSLGHAHIVYTLTRAVASLKKTDIIAIETGTKKTHLFPIRRFADHLFLPQQKSGIHWSRALFRALKHIRPDVFLTEHYPFFRHPEHQVLLPILKQLRSSKTTIISSTVHLDWTSSLNLFLPHHYDLVLYHWPQAQMNSYESYLPADERKLLKAVLRQCRHKLAATGFVHDDTDFKECCRDAGPGLRVVVSRGGLQDHPGLIRSCLRVALKRPDWHFAISAGTAAPQALKRKGNRQTALEYFSWKYPEFEQYLRDADVSINLAGYNTMVRLLRYRIPSLILPAATAEQRWNARFLAQYAAARILSAKDISPEKLERSIAGLADRCEHPKTRAVPENWFRGAARSAELILEHL
ncbi:MAG: glycosyltransferase [Candidatus Velamenicoccus archaeovorus]